jgi:hypothetical protein
MACARLPRAVLVSLSLCVTADGELAAMASMIFTTFRKMGTWSALASAPPSLCTHICSACSSPFSTRVICVCGLVVSATASRSKPRSRCDTLCVPAAVTGYARLNSRTHFTAALALRNAPEDPLRRSMRTSTSERRFAVLGAP